MYETYMRHSASSPDTQLVLHGHPAPTPAHISAEYSAIVARPSTVQRLRRQSSVLRERRQSADALTHPSGNFHLPPLAARDAAHAGALLAAYCARICPWGRANLEPASPCARMLHVLQTLSVQLQTAAAARLAAPESPRASQANATAALDLARAFLAACDLVEGFRLSFEVDGHICDVAELVLRLHSFAVLTLLALFTST